MRPVISTNPLRTRADALKIPSSPTFPLNLVSKRGTYTNLTSPLDIVRGKSAPSGGWVQSPLITFVRVSSPLYCPSNLAELCANAIPTPVANTTPSPSHLSIQLFPVQVRLQVTKSRVRTDWCRSLGRAQLRGVPALYPA